MIGGIEGTEDISSGNRLPEDTEASGTSFMLEFSGQRKSRRLSNDRSYGHAMKPTPTQTQKDLNLSSDSSTVYVSLALYMTFYVEHILCTQKMG